MIEHPLRDGWKQNFTDVVVQENEAEITGKDKIAIARGKNPIAKGSTGSILGFLVDDGTNITECKLIRVSEQQSGKWLELKDREVVPV